MLGINYITAEAWGSPAITMLQDSVSPKNLAFSVSAYLFFTTIAGMVATEIMSSSQKYLDAENDTRIYGYTLCGMILVSYLGCVPFFYLAGRHYTGFMGSLNKN